jgi:hypothetical protein
MVQLGGDLAWKQRVYGDLVLNLQWINLEPDLVGSAEEPAIFLFRKPRPGREVTGAACVIPLNLAHQWVYSDFDGKGSRSGHVRVEHAVPAATDFAKAMGFEVSKGIVNRIIDVVVDGIDELQKMPPKPRHIQAAEEAIAAAERESIAGEAVMTVKRDGEVIHEGVVKH